MEEFYRELGARLRSAREEAGLSQAAAAARVGLSRASITNIERGEQRVSLRVFVEMAAALGATPASLLPPADGITARVGTALRQDGAHAAIVDWVERAITMNHEEGEGDSDA